MLRSPSIFLVVYLVVLSFPVLSQEGRYSKELEERITRVEKSLSGWILAPYSNWNLGDRMKDHKIHGVSIAVITDYKLEWARGYGWADTSDKRRVTNQTLFQAASISKSLNAVGV